MQQAFLPITEAPKIIAYQLVATGKAMILPMSLADVLLESFSALAHVNDAEASANAHRRKIMPSTIASLAQYKSIILFRER